MTTSSSASQIVIDAGVGFALCTEHPASATARAALGQQVTSDTTLFAPSIWCFELTSILTKAVHFKEMSERSAREALELSGDLNVQLIVPDRELVTHAFDWTLRLKRASAYDSFYLALAQNLGCDLWTLDRRLANAVAEPWVRFMGSET